MLWTASVAVKSGQVSRGLRGTVNTQRSTGNGSARYSRVCRPRGSEKTNTACDCERATGLPSERKTPHGTPLTAENWSAPNARGAVGVGVGRCSSAASEMRESGTLPSNSTVTSNTAAATTTARSRRAPPSEDAPMGFQAVPSGSACGASSAGTTGGVADVEIVACDSVRPVRRSVTSTSKSSSIAVYPRVAPLHRTVRFPSIGALWRAVNVVTRGARHASQAKVILCWRPAAGTVACRPASTPRGPGPRAKTRGHLCISV